MDWTLCGGAEPACSWNTFWVQPAGGCATSVDVSVADFTVHEVIKAIAKQKNNKAVRIDEIPTELLKHGQDELADKLTNVFNTMWQKEDVPGYWRQGVILPLSKKGCLRYATTGKELLWCLSLGKHFAQCSWTSWTQRLTDSFARNKLGSVTADHASNKYLHLGTSWNSAESSRHLYLLIVSTSRRLLTVFIANHYGKSSNCMVFQINSSTSSNLCTTIPIACQDTRWSHQCVWCHHWRALRLHPFTPAVPNLHWLCHEKGTEPPTVWNSLGSW